MYQKLLLLYLVALCVLLSECVISNKTNSCTPVKLLRGRVKYRQRGKLAKFQCNTGYILAGERYSSCIKGVWDAKIPMCVKPSCGKVKPPLNGLIYPQYQGAVLNFFCKSGYVLRGNQVTYCDGFRWSNNLPTCTPSGAEPPMSCDFESEDICGWQHDLNHDFDWRRYNFQTPSGHIGTGPRYDHTKGEGKDGYYMYIESSSRIENDTARLISPVYNKMDDGMCFTFYYHMYGSGIGSLQVFVKLATDSYDTKYLKPEFVESGNQGDVWKRGVVSVASVDQPFQIIIEGIRGKSYVSDIAIDDVNLTDYVCEEDEFSTISTTEESTDIVPIVESCVNRCDNNSDTIYIDSFVLACDCVDSCIENNSCCPDYVAVCVLGTDFTESYDTTRDNNDHTEQFTVAVRATTEPTQDLPTATPKPQTSTAPTTKWTGSRPWMDTTTTSRPTPRVVIKPTQNSTAKPSTNRTSTATTTTTVKPTVTTVTRRWFNATRIPGISTPTARPRIPYRPYPTIRPRATNTTTVQNTTSTTGNATNPRTAQKTTNTTGIATNPATAQNANTTGIDTNKTTVQNTNTTGIATNTTTVKNTTGNTTNPTTVKNTNSTANATNLRPYFPKNTTKPRIDISSTTKPKITKNITKSSFNEVIKPELPTQNVTTRPPAVQTLAPVVPTERNSEPAATLEMETDYIDTNSEEPIEFAKIAPIIEDKATADTHMIMGVLCGVVFVMLVALSAVLVGRKYNWRMCRRFQNGRHSDSMSDVRFLASDEVLDFTWRSAHN